LHENVPGKVSALNIEIAPDLSPYIEKASFVLSKPEHISAELLSPDKITPDFLFEDNEPRYSVFTVENPVGGEWSLHFSSDAEIQAYAILHSRLRVKIISPQEFHQVGQPLRIVVQMLEETENGELRKIIGTSSFSALITNPDGSKESLDLFYDDGTHGDELSGDGNFTRLYITTEQVGEYKIEILGNKGSVQVTGESQTIVEVFPQLLNDKAPIGYEVRAQPILLNVYIDNLSDQLDIGEVKALIQSPSGEESQIQMTASKDSFQGSFMPKENGVYHLRFFAENATYRGISYELEVEAEFKVKIIRTLSVSLPRQTTTVGCFSKDYLIPLDLNLVSTQAERVQIAMSDLPGQIMSSTQLELSPGEHSERVRVSLASIPFFGESYIGNLTVGADKKLNITTSSSLPIYLEVPPIWVRCRESALKYAWALAGLLFVTVVVMRRVRRQKMPNLVSGTLRYWEEGENLSKTKEWDLTAFQKESLLIGSGKKSDLCLKDAGLETRHAQISVEKTDAAVVMLLEPVAKIRKGYHNLSAPLPLAHGDSFQMGKYEFQFLSDTGE
jgi:hypothetical protein